MPDGRGGRLPGGWFLGAVTLAVNLGSFLFLVMVARSTSPQVFGALAALAGIALLFEVPAAALRAAIGNSGTAGAATETFPAPAARPVNGRLLVATTAWGVLVYALLAAISPLLRDFLHLPDVDGVVLLGAYAVPVAVSVVPRGSLAAQGRLVPLAAGLVSGIVVRLGVGIALVHNGAGLDGALVAMISGELVAALVVLVAAGRATGAVPAVTTPAVTSPAAVDVERNTIRRADVRGPAVAFTGYWLLSAIDVILARHWLGTHGSGLYAAAATLAQVALLAPGAVAAVAFPRIIGTSAGHQAHNLNPRLALAVASAVVAMVGFAVATAVSLLASPAIADVFDSQYRGAATVVGLLTFSGAVFGLVTVMLHYHLGEGLWAPPKLCWAGIVIVVAGTSIWHRSMTEIAASMVVATAAVCLAMIAVAQGHAKGQNSAIAQRAQLALADADLDLTVVVPYYNPGDLLVPTVQRILSTLEGSGATYEVIAVSDGSSDGSDRELTEALSQEPRLTNVVLAQNQGKGAALRLGLARGRGRYLGFIDADGDLDPVLLGSFETMVRLYEPDIILGSKRHPLSEVDYPVLRRAYSWGYQQLVRAGFRLNIKDTQTGIKLVRRDVLAAVLPRMVEKRFAFDLELFVAARRLGYRRFLEAPIRLHHQFTSTVNPKAVARTGVDTLAIWYRLRVLHHYDGDQAPATPQEERLRLEPVVLRGSAEVARPQRERRSPVR